MNKQLLQKTIITKINYYKNQLLQKSIITKINYYKKQLLQKSIITKINYYKKQLLQKTIITKNNGVNVISSIFYLCLRVLFFSLQLQSENKPGINFLD
jgi:hypothetical protein